MKIVFKGITISSPAVRLEMKKIILKVDLSMSEQTEKNINQFVNDLPSLIKFVDTLKQKHPINN